MIRPRQIRLKLSKSQFQHCQQLSQESAHVWNSVKNFFWRTYRKKGIWLSESSMKRYISRKEFALHSQSVQAVVEKFYDNLDTARTLRKENPSIGKLVIGDVTGIAQNTNNEKRLNRKNRQKVSQGR